MTTSYSRPEYLRRRVELTTSCRDAEDLPRVPNAGGYAQHQGHEVQLMHNGVRVIRGGYYGEWMSEIIARLGGVHEPQEEKAVAAIFQQLAKTPRSADPMVCVELGSFWGYYSLWFLEEFNNGRVVCLEPDPGYMQIGVTNFELNDRSATFIAGAVGTEPDTAMEFVAESDGVARPTRLFTLESLMTESNVAHIDVLFVDIQGFEIALLETAQDLLRSGVVRFMVVSTHDMGLTQSPMTHRHAESLLLSAGAHIICEHSVSESYSADGLIVASFDERDKEMKVTLSHARAVDSCFGEWEPRLFALQDEFAQIQARTERERTRDGAVLLRESEQVKAQLVQERARVEVELEHERNRADDAARNITSLNEHIAAEQQKNHILQSSLSWRVTAPIRWLGDRLGGRPHA